MRNRIKPLLLAAAGMIAPLGLLSMGGVQPALAASPASLPIASYYQMAVDVAHGHIFISQGSSGQNGILVTDLTGQVVTTITGQAGQRHLRIVMAEYAQHYNGRRPHRALQLQPPQPDHPVADLSQEQIKRRSVLGGLLNEYERAA